MNLITSDTGILIIFSGLVIVVLIGIAAINIAYGVKTCKHPERATFCCGRIAFVKCTTCGAESIPWQVREETASNWHESHPDYMKRLLEIEANAKLYWSKR